MDKISCSCTWGRGNINHNFNKYSRSRQDHIDKTKTNDNIVLREVSNKTVEEKFNKIFEEDIQEYNSKQKRKDRRIDNYYQKCLSDKKIKAPFREVIYQVGNKEDAKDPEKLEKMKNSLKRFYEEFEKNYPNLKVIGAVIHLDEATPHLHMDIVPYAENSKNGLKHKVSFEKAIEQMGFEPEESQVNKKAKKPLIFNGFRNHSMKLLENILNEEGMERDIKHNTKKHLEPAEYREKMAIEDLKKSPAFQEKVVENILKEMPQTEKENNIIKEQNKAIDMLYKENEELKKELKWYQRVYEKFTKTIASLFFHSKTEEEAVQIEKTFNTEFEDDKDKVLKDINEELNNLTESESEGIEL